MTRFSKKESAGTGLVLAYLINLWLIHWPGAVAYLSSSSTAVDLDPVEVGFRISSYGVVAFVIGSLVFGPFIAGALKRRANVVASSISMMQASKAYIIIGILFYISIGSFLAFIPSVRSLLSSGWQLVVVGICIALWFAWQRRDSRRLWIILLMSLTLPLITLVTQGFVSFGVAALIAICAFTAIFYRPRVKLVLVGLLVGYIAFSFYIGYMKERETIRDAVWGGQDYSVRLERMKALFTSFEFFNPLDPDHLKDVDQRLNQNILVGASVSYLSNGFENYASGETLVEAVEALIPRAFWPDKPLGGGSGDLVSRYTGISFGVNTSVGIGQVLEFYINFGVIGVIIGFLFLGTIIGVVDQMAMYNLAGGSWRGFTLWYLPGLALLQAGGQLVEITAGAAAALTIASLVTWALFLYYRVPMQRQSAGGKIVPKSKPSLNLPSTNNTLESRSD